MDSNTVRAYRVVLSAALLHLKWDLAILLNGFSWLNPRRALFQFRAARRAAERAYAFHNLAVFSALDFEGFSEAAFWKDVAKFQENHAESVSPYRTIFERTQRGEAVNIVAPDGVGMR